MLAVSTGGGLLKEEEKGIIPVFLGPHGQDWIGRHFLLLLSDGNRHRDGTDDGRRQGRGRHEVVGTRLPRPTPSKPVP